MENWGLVALDIAVLAFFGGLLYVFLKRRILKNAKLELLAQISSLQEELNKSNDNSERELAKEIAIYLETQDLKKIRESISSLPSDKFSINLSQLKDELAYIQKH